MFGAEAEEKRLAQKLKRGETFEKGKLRRNVWMRGEVEQRDVQLERLRLERESSVPKQKRRVKLSKRT